MCSLGSVPPPWRNGFVPRCASWGPAWTGTSWGTPWSSVNCGTPALPARQPDHNVWSFPSGDLTWSPNGYTYFPTIWTPAAHPTWPWPPTDHGRPKFIPWLALNPFQRDMPMLEWDVRQHHITARLTTGAHITTNLEHAMSSPATDPPVSIIEIAIQGYPMAHPWNVIRVQRTSTITVADVLTAVYNWLQTPLSQAEMDHIECISPASVEAVYSAFQERARTSPALHGWEHIYGPRRIDCLGDTRRWIGLSYSPTGQGMQLVLDLQTIPRLI
ncbi:hypothetical protein K503DRAFT_260469 [Rhizopogon vinicolor AM-OR11-026]|uniref:DUF6699 domain-containing protein n=1 Tax=Rhizopogon vinicolor AM-OR11-026 TaxID=1314800 RepID=A0A1B7MWS6_9AGAM|nr:hypothetical protein K503DRAFT_260469 [Rhizopogon vinicolor AM-OR11-026]